MDRKFCHCKNINTVDMISQQRRKIVRGLRACPSGGQLMEYSYLSFYFTISNPVD